jgi:hypothetical protein
MNSMILCITYFLRRGEIMQRIIALAIKHNSYNFVDGIEEQTDALSSIEVTIEPAII